ncbi:hypothetical protein AAMO2058_000620200 [Amorphochlora amoebiformis]
MGVCNSKEAPAELPTPVLRPAPRQPAPRTIRPHYNARKREFFFHVETEWGIYRPRPARRIIPAAIDERTTLGMMISSRTASIASSQSSSASYINRGTSDECTPRTPGTSAKHSAAMLTQISISPIAPAPAKVPNPFQPSGKRKKPRHMRLEGFVL